MEYNWFELLLQSDIDTIENICMSNKEIGKTCKDKYFWEQKFEYDNLPILTMQNTQSGWIKEYKMHK